MGGQDEKYWRGLNEFIGKKPDEWLEDIRSKRVEINGHDPIPEFYLKCLRYAENAQSSAD